MKILYLSVWYPSKQDKMAGLFVQKHVEAIRAQGAEVRVNTFWPQADLIQLNVLTLKWGLVALLMKKLLKIPYIIVEHWSGYLPQNGSFEKQAAWKRKLLHKIGCEAEGIYPVSQMLENNMKRCGIENQCWGQVENVVDEFFYQETTTTANGLSPKQNTSLLHISCFDEKSKNVKGLLRAITSIAERRQDFHLTLVGQGADWQDCQEYANSLGIDENLLQWTGEISPEAVCKQMQKSDVLLLTSRYETYGVPLAEAVASGLPVIETQTCGVQVSKACGLSVPAEDDQALAQAIEHMLDHHQDYDKKAIRQEGLKYRFAEVGKQLMAIYESVLS